MSESYDTQGSVQYGQELPYYVNGLGLVYDSATLLQIAPGSCLDSTGTYQLNSNVTMTLNIAVNGLNGLDQGTKADNKVYAVYVVWDPVTNLPAGGLFSLSYTQPLLPYGYSAFLLVGYVAIDNSGNILKGYWTAGNSSTRSFTYDAFQATAVTAGSSSTYANVDLTKWVPLVNNLPVSIYTNFASNAAADILALQAGNGTGDQAVIIAQVAGSSAHLGTLSPLLAQTVAISTVPSPVINYKVSAGTVAVDVAGYTWFV